MYSHDPASSVAISRWPLLRDPWEDAMVEVAQSRLEQAGEVRDSSTPILYSANWFCVANSFVL